MFVVEQGSQSEVEGGEIGEEDTWRGFGRWSSAPGHIVYQESASSAEGSTRSSEIILLHMLCKSTQRSWGMQIGTQGWGKTQEEHKWDNFISGSMVPGDKAWSCNTVQMGLSLWIQEPSVSEQEENHPTEENSPIFILNLGWELKRKQFLLRISSLRFKNLPVVGLEFCDLNNLS